MSRKEMNQIRCIAALTAGFAKKFDLGQRQPYTRPVNRIVLPKPPTIHTLTCNRSQQPMTIEGKYIFLYLQQKAKAQADRLYPVLIIKNLLSASTLLIMPQEDPLPRAEEHTEWDGTKKAI